MLIDDGGANGMAIHLEEENTVPSIPNMSRHEMNVGEETRTETRTETTMWKGERGGDDEQVSMILRKRGVEKASGQRPPA